jgi:hypothetical protein
VTFGTHGTFYLREGWIYKIIKYAKEDPNIFSDTEAPVILGVGKNMVNALRFWGSAAGIIDYNRKSNENKFSSNLTDFGVLVEKYDPYLEHIETIWLMHLNIISHVEHTSSWFWLFNEYPYENLSLEVEQFPNKIQNWIDENYKSAKISKPNVSSVTLNRDINCLMHTYLKENVSKDPEDNLTSPFSQLNLFLNGMNNLTFNSLEFHEVPHSIFKQSILMYSDNKYQDNRDEIIETNIFDLISDKFSPGRSLRLSNNGIYDHLVYMINENTLPKVKLRRTAGLDQISYEFSTDMVKSNVKEIMEGYEN